jgi:hypothetical protein
MKTKWDLRSVVVVAGVALMIFSITAPFFVWENAFGKLMLFATLMLWGAYGYWRDVERPDGLDSARRDANEKRE